MIFLSMNKKLPTVAEAWWAVTEEDIAERKKRINWYDFTEHTGIEKATWWVLSRVLWLLK